MKQYILFLVSMTILFFLFGITSVAQAQEEAHFIEQEPKITKEGKYDRTGRNNLFFIPVEGVFQDDGKLFVYAEKIQNDRVNASDIACTITTNNKFETFRMVVEVKRCRYANPADLAFARRNRSDMYTLLRTDSETGYSILYRSKSNGQIEKDLERISKIKNLTPKL